MQTAGVHGGGRVENPNADITESSPPEDRAPTTTEDLSDGTDDIPSLHEVLLYTRSLDRTLSRRYRLRIDRVAPLSPRLE